MNRPWSIRLLGQLRAERDDLRIEKFRTEKTGALLAYLAFYPSVPVSRETLIGMLWPDYTPEAGRNCLSIALHSLRRQFEPSEVPRGSVFFADRSHLCIRQEAIRTDAACFERLASEALDPAPSGEEIPRLREALALYQGALLPDYYEDWILAQRLRLEERFFALSLALLRLLIQHKSYHEALQHVHRALAIDGTREEFVRMAMGIYTALKQPDGALQIYKQLRDRLHAEGVELERRTTRLLEELQGVVADSIDLPVEPVAPPALAGDVWSLDGTITLLLLEVNVSAVGEPPLRQEILSYEGASAHRHILRESPQHLLVAFRGVGEALQCAVKLHRRLRERNPAPSFRIALHTGDYESWEPDAEDGPEACVDRLLRVTQERQILCTQSSASIISSRLRALVQLKDLGLYRWRRPEAPERLYQIRYEGDSQTGWTPPAPLNPEPSVLSARRSRFFGGQEEFQQILEWLRSSQTRLFTLKGPGGIGKTRMAQELAGALAGADFPAVWFVSLGELASAEAIPKQVLDALRISPDPVRTPIEQIVETLIETPTVLIFDNFEHLIAEGVHFVKALLDRIPSLTCLVTSRIRLRLEGEREWTVRPLAVPPAKTALEKLELFPSVQLFVDRAQNVLPDFHLTAYNADAVRQICTRLDGIPLAIELAASRIHTLTPQQMVAQLDRPFDLLRQPRRGVVERQRTMRAAVEWSYRLLEPELQEIFRRLSVFRGGWTAEAAEAVCRADMAHDLLAQLLECSLIYTEERNHEIRFRMLETLREFAALQLQEEEVAEARLRHLEYYMALCERIERLLGGPDQAKWLDLLETEHENLLVALRTEGRPEWNLRLATALHQFWFVRGYLKEGSKQLEAALANAPGVPDAERARGLLGACAFASVQGNFPAAKRFGEEALEAYRSMGHQRGVAGCLNNLSDLARRMGDTVLARRYLEKGLRIYRDLQETAFVTRVLANLGGLANAQGDYEKALLWLNEGRTLAEQLGDRFTLASILHSLGLLHYREKQWSQAGSLYLQSIAIRQELKDRHSVTSVLNSLGILAVARHEDSLAPQLFGFAAATQVASAAVLSERETAEIAQAVQEVRVRLGEPRFDALYSQGAQQSLEAVLEAAYSAIENAPTPEGP